MSKFVCGVDITFKMGVKFAMDPMGMFDSIEDAVKCNQGLHSSFGYSIYEVNEEVTLNLTRSYGFRAGTHGPGFAIIRFVGNAYNLPGWVEE
jgi:hypothetical protein